MAAGSYVFSQSGPGDERLQTAFFKLGFQNPSDTGCVNVNIRWKSEEERVEDLLGGFLGSGLEVVYIIFSYIP